MWIEELTIENIKCFESIKLPFIQKPSQKHPWITFLSENGCGKSTALQALGLLIAGPEAAQVLMPRPLGWLRNADRVGKIGCRIHQDEIDPGKHGSEKISKSFAYSYTITGSQHATVNNKLYTEPTIVPAGQSRLTWLRENAFVSKGNGWFSAGYGAFRRLTRSSQIIVPALEPQARFANFLTQFDESEALSVFERWMVYLDYRVHKDPKDSHSVRLKEIGVDAINRVLPDDARFDHVTAEGRIVFVISNQKVSTIGMSDGYRSILALVGDLIWRLIQAFPESEEPLLQPGIVLIDELDIHLHPCWQRQIPIVLRSIFPGIQFVVATHSPLIASGAGPDSLALRFRFEDGATTVASVKGIHAWSVEKILESEAFSVVSPFSPQTQQKITRYDQLAAKTSRDQEEQKEYQLLLEFMKEARPIGGPTVAGSLEDKIDKYIDKAMR